MRVVPRRFLLHGSVLGLLMLLPAGWALAAEEAEEQLNYGREAREGTPILDRDPDAPLTEKEKIYHLLSRFTYGPTAKLMKEVEDIGMDDWVKAQLDGNIDESTTLRNHLEKLESLNMTCQELRQTYNPPMPAELSLQRKLNAAQRRERSKYLQLRYVPRNQLKDAVILRAVYGNNHLLEVATDIWRNHFNIDVSKAMTRYYGNEFERLVTRAEALGSFREMLNKQARHPAMLVYLDNYISRGQPEELLYQVGREALMKSRDYGIALQAIDIAKMSGLNENYARELMELHTLGVDNFYNQDDVIAVAECLTGWTFQQHPDKPIVFQFRPDMHATGNKKVLRKTIRANRRNPEQEGQEVLDMLVKHRGTAQFIAYKILRRFVDDHPSEQLIKRTAKAFQKNKYHLGKTYWDVYKSDEFFDPQHYQSKFKKPSGVRRQRPARDRCRDRGHRQAAHGAHLDGRTSLPV